MDGDLLISIVIPVKNGDYWLEDLLGNLERQTLFHRSEIIVIDSGSTDRSLEIVRRHPARLVTIPPEEFNHGATRNFGVQLARGRYVVMTVQDAIPVDDGWLQTLLDGFGQDGAAGFDGGQVAGVCGQQIVPHDPDKNPVEWFRPVSAPEKRTYHFPDKASFARLNPLEKRRICGWDNVNAMYDRDILLRMPFRPLAFAEDGMWAKDALEAGYAIVYQPAARVNHYHYEPPDYAFRRHFTVSYHFYRIFALKPSAAGSTVRPLLSNARLLWRERRLGWKDKWKWLLYNYRWRKAVRRSVRVFNAALRNGEDSLDAMHGRICGAPPQAIKPITV